MNVKLFFSNNTDIWETPKEIYNYYINRNYFDPCPLNPSFNGLLIEWQNKNFINPPYSQLKKWVNKAIEENKKGKECVLLIPARTDTKAFKMLIENKATIILLEGRLKFSNKNSAPLSFYVSNFKRLYDL